MSKSHRRSETPNPKPKSEEFDLGDGAFNNLWLLTPCAQALYERMRRWMDVPLCSPCQLSLSSPLLFLLEQNPLHMLPASTLFMTPNLLNQDCITYQLYVYNLRLLLFCWCWILNEFLVNSVNNYEIYFNHGKIILDTKCKHTNFLFDHNNLFAKVPSIINTFNY